MRSMVGGKAMKSGGGASSSSTLFGAVALVLVTFTGTRILDGYFNTCSSSSSSSTQEVGKPHKSFGTKGNSWWPHQGYGINLDLRIYVYEDWELPGLKELQLGRAHNINPQSCAKGQWGTQVKIHQLLLQSEYRTRRKEEAQLFFVPTYVKCVRMNGGLTDKEINEKFVQILKYMPYFRRSGGRDHIFIFPSGAGAHLFKDWGIYLNRSIFLTPEGDRTDKRGTSAFNTWKDIIIPGYVDESMTSGGESEDAVKPIPLTQRKFVANYLGRAQGKAGRLQLIELAEKFPHELEAPNLALSGSMKLGRREYFEHLRNAKFCLAPRGESSWTLRFYESFFVECVPVILSDQIELPFQNVIDYSQFSIKWPSTRISEELLNYLQSIPDADVERMLAHGRAIRCLFVYAPKSGSCSAMEGILWELQRKVRVFHQSAETFWLHNGTMVDRKLIPMQSWAPPLLVP